MTRLPQVFDMPASLKFSCDVLGSEIVQQHNRSGPVIMISETAGRFAVQKRGSRRSGRKQLSVAPHFLQADFWLVILT